MSFAPRLAPLSAALLSVGLAAPAFALTPGSGTWVKETATYGTPNLQDAYVYVPKNANPLVKNGKRALMLTMHGCAQTASGNVIDTKFNWESTAEKYGMVVIAPTTPSGTSSTRAASGCWDWFGAAHNRTSRDAVPLKKLIDAVKARTNLDIDPNQVYVTGLSSGGGQTIVMGCTFPDVFAGMGINAGPALGSASGDISVDPKVSAAQVRDNCKSANGNAYNSHFATQLANVVYGSSDYLVKPSHNTRNVDGLKLLYGADVNGGTFTLTGSGTGQTWNDASGRPRITSVSIAGMGHAWPSGPGGAPYIAFVENKYVNYPEYITEFFFNNNLRVSGGTTTPTPTPAPTATPTTTPTPTNSPTPTPAPTQAPSAVQAGPGAWSSNQTWGADAAHGGNLQGFFYWPATQPALNGKRALVLVLHGCGQTASGDVIDSTSDGGFNWKSVADQYGAVILAPNATGNVLVHCWDYYGKSHSRTAGHSGVLLDLINRFKNDPKYAIDPNQIYVTGLSSGGGQAMVMACLAPDVFAGIGNNAGPALGTSSGQIGSVPSGFTATTAKNNCVSLAGSNASHFSTQIANAVWGTSDYTVGQAYGPLNMDAMRQVYGGTYSSSSFSVTGGGTGTQHTANGKVRTSQISVSGLAHAWPAGTGGQNSNYVSSTKVHYPQYIMDFWFTNNLRVAATPTPAPTSTPTPAPTSTPTPAPTSTPTPAPTSTPTPAPTSTPTPTPAGACFTATNYAHVTAGRATQSAGYAYAVGSNQKLGLYNMFYSSKLRQTGTSHYVIDATCP